MNIWLKRIAFGLVVAILAATVGLAIFLLTFNPNAYKDKLQDLVYNRYHRTLTINGDISLSLFPRIGLSVREVALSNREGKDVFVSIDSARFAVAIWPLLSNQLVVDHVAINGVKAWVTRDAEGRFNFSDLMGPETVATQAPSRAAAPAAAPAILATKAAQGTDLDIDIAGLEVKDGQVHYLDQRTGMSATMSAIEAATGRVTYNQPFDVSIKGNLAGQAPMLAARFEAQALLRLDPVARSYAAQKINVQFNGRAGALDKAVVGLRGNLAYQGQERTFSAANLELQVAGDVLGAQPIQGLKATLSAPQIRLDQRNTELKIDKLALRASGQAAQGALELAFDAPALAISPESAQGEPVSGTFKVAGDDKIALAFGLEGLSGNANELRLRMISLDGGITQAQRLTQIKLTSPAIWDRSLRKGSLSAIKGDLSIRDPSAEGPIFEFPMIGSVHLDQIKDVLDVDLNAVIDGAQLAFKSQTKRLADPQTNFSLVADRLDLNHWMASPVAKTPASAPAGGDGADESAKKPAKPASAPPAPAEETRIDWSMLKGHDITGTIEVKDLRARNLQLRDLKANTRLQEGKLQISKLSAKLYEGTLSGDLTASADQTLGVELAFDKVAVEPFLRAVSNQGRVSGTLGARIDLDARGDTVKAILASLAGRSTWKVADGALHGVDASRSIQEASGLLRNALKGQIGALPNPFGENRRTPFSTFEGRIDFKDGQGKISKLALVSELIKVTEGKPATINLPDQRVDLMLNAQITNRPPKALAETVGSLRGATLPIHISGPFEHLAYNIEWETVRNQAIKEAVKSGLMNLVPGGIEIPKLAPAASAPAAPSPAKSAKEPDPVKRIGDALKGLLSQ